MGCGGFDKPRAVGLFVFPFVVETFTETVARGAAANFYRSARKHDTVCQSAFTSERSKKRLSRQT